MRKEMNNEGRKLKFRRNKRKRKGKERENEGKDMMDKRKN